MMSLAAFAVADLEHGLREAQLMDQRRAHRSAGNDMAVADAAPAVDHQKRVVHVDAGALEAVVHDQEIAAARGKQPGPGGAIRRHHDRRVLGEKQRLVADVTGAVVMSVDHMRRRKVAAEAARQEAGRKLHAPGLPGERDRAPGVLPAPPTVKLPTQSTGTSIFSRLA